MYKNKLFSLPTKIYFEDGIIDSLKDILKEENFNKALLISTPFFVRNGMAEKIKKRKRYHSRCFFRLYTKSNLIWNWKCCKQTKRNWCRLCHCFRRRNLYWLSKICKCICKGWWKNTRLLFWKEKTKWTSTINCNSNNIRNWFWSYISICLYRWWNFNKSSS